VARSPVSSLAQAIHAHEVRVKSTVEYPSSVGVVVQPVRRRQVGARAEPPAPSSRPRERGPAPALGGRMVRP
jgi:hypothetical protein